MIHYYGDSVRQFFVAGAIIMLVTLPFLNALLPVPLFYSILAIVILSLIAGATSPTKHWVIIFDEVIAAAAVLVFEYYAVHYYTLYSAASALFIVNQVLALNFLLALYYNTKTVRSMTSKNL